MDWYHRQLDEIVSSLSHLPDIKIFLPDLGALGDAGWISSFSSGMKQQVGNIFSMPSSSFQGNQSTQSSRVPVTSSTQSQTGFIDQAGQKIDDALTAVDTAKNTVVA